MRLSARALLRLVAAIAFVVVIGVSVWVLSRPPHGRTADCATAHAMWIYLGTQLASQRAAAQKADADNTKTEAAYRNMVDGLQGYADRITTPDVRTKADTIVAINQDMFEQWKRWAAESQSETSFSAGPTPADKKFGHEFASDGRKLEIVHAELELACAS
jgi:hypothetical protein